MALSLSLPDLPRDPVLLERQIEERERADAPLKPGCRAKIIWKEPHSKKKTEYALVYLHGFTASHGEGAPVHHQLAEAVGCNLYLSRLARHGIKDRNPFKGLTPQHLLDSAAYALAVGKAIGEKVIIMGTSTGGTLGLYLAAHLPDTIHALLLYSPLIDFSPLKSLLLTTPAGRKLLSAIPGKNYELASIPNSNRESTIWYTRYRMEGALALGELVQQTMTRETLVSISCPVFVGYYYKSFFRQDRVVSVRAIRKLITLLEENGVIVHKKRYPDASTHVISCGIISKSVESLRQDSLYFLNNIINNK